MLRSGPKGRVSKHEARAALHPSRRPLRGLLRMRGAHESGPMLEPLKDEAYFQRVFVEDGVLTWPNGYDWDPIALHDEMKDAGELRRVGDAAE
jgi:hypothetical protein